MSDTLHGPDRASFKQWLSAHFIANNRTKTISAEKYERICRYIDGKDNSNAKFRYWVKSKGFSLFKSGDVALTLYRDVDGKELFIRHEPKKLMNCKKESKKFERKTNCLFEDSKVLPLYRRVAAVEDFYDIIRNVHVDKYGAHAGQKQTYKIVSSIYAFLPREVVTRYLVNCDFCKPRITKYGNMSSATKKRRSTISLSASKEEELEINCSQFRNEEDNKIEFDERDLLDGSSFTSQNEEIPCSFDEGTNNEVVPKEGESIASSLVSVESSPLPVSQDGSKLVQPTNKGIAKQSIKKERMKPTGSGRRLSYSTETDEKLLNWVKDSQDSRIMVTREMLQKQALSLIQLECPEFKASSGWVEKFLVRHGITLPGMCRNVNNLGNERGDKDAKRNGEATADRVDFPREPIIREPPNLSELLNNVHSNSPSTKDEDEDNDDDDDDDADENEADSRRNQSAEINPDRLKAFNMFVRLFVDENLDRLVPISKQPKEKINAIILSCQRQFPEFSERARKRIRTYLKSCRRSSRLKEPLKRASENMSAATAHIPSTQLAEVNNILSQACYNESREVSKRARFDIDASDNASQSKHQDKHPVLHLAQNNPVNMHSHDRHVQKYMPFSSASRTPPVKLSTSEISAVRQLINGYRESAAFLYRSADELENLLKQSENYYGQQQQQQEQQQQHK